MKALAESDVFGGCHVHCRRMPYLFRPLSGRLHCTVLTRHILARITSQIKVEKGGSQLNCWRLAYCVIFCVLQFLFAIPGWSILVYTLSVRTHSQKTCHSRARKKSKRNYLQDGALHGFKSVWACVCMQAVSHKCVMVH